MVSPISHLIALGLLAWLAQHMRAASRGTSRGGATALIVGTLASWLLVSSWLAYRGLYLSLNEAWLLILWGTAAPLVLLGTVAVASSRARSTLANFALETPLPALIRIHAVRILALGTLYKWFVGELPTHFMLPVGIPDFFIGLTAFWIAHLFTRDPERARPLLIAWNAVGAAVLLAAPALIQLSQPGPFQLYFQGPTTHEVLGFPMSIVPTLVAPVFVGLHLIALHRLLARPDDLR